jgi:hypothetical protein
MESYIVLLAFICLMLSAVIGLFDGMYLHVWKYKLYYHNESRFEHLIHSIRLLAMIFITYFLFVKDYGGWMLWLGALFLIIDIIALSVDVFSESDSRSHLGGLSSIEYYIHVVANGLHFTSSALILAIKPIEAWSFYSPLYLERFNDSIVPSIAASLIPGTVIAGLIHLLLLNKKFAISVLQLQKKLAGKLEFVTLEKPQ